MVSATFICTFVIIIIIFTLLFVSMFCTGKKGGDEVVAVLANFLVVNARHVCDSNLSCSLDIRIEPFLEDICIRAKNGDRIGFCLQLVCVNGNRLINNNNNINRT